MNTTQPVPTVRKLAEPARNRPPERPIDRHDPLAGLWAHRLGQVLVWSLLLAVVPGVLALGLGWVRWNEAQQFAPLLRQLATGIWTLSLVGLILAVVGLSQFGSKSRTLQGLFIHLTLTLGPFVMTIFLR